MAGAFARSSPDHAHETDHLSGAGQTFYTMMDMLAATIERWRTEPLPIASDAHGDRPVEDLRVTEPRCNVLWAGYNNLRFDDDCFVIHSLPPSIRRT